jgi:5-methylcytosine-specific restriction endonuclease McrA
MGKKERSAWNKVQIKEVRAAFINRGYEPLFINYSNAIERLDAKTNEGYVISVAYHGIKTEKVPTVFGNGNPHTINNIRHYLKLENINCELMSSEFKSAGKDKLLWSCDKGHQFYMTWNSVQQGRRCPFCAGTHKKTTEQFRAQVSESTCGEYLLLGEYNRDCEHVKIRHIKCGHEYMVTPSHFLGGRRCPKCAIRYGENNNKYNPELLPEDRVLRRVLYGESIIKWRTSVYEKDNYTCVKCKTRGRYLHAHHLDGYNWCKEKRFEVSNGITLCRKCHRDFHLIYGMKDNTREQFAKYL